MEAASKVARSASAGIDGVLRTRRRDKQAARQELKQALKLKSNFEGADETQGLLRSLR
jgi:hypothetical protein